MQSNKIFRQAALDQLSSPEQLHHLMRVTDAKGWLALAGCAVILLTAIFWGIFGTVQTKVSASGILLGGGGLTELTAQSEGDITSIEVAAGDIVKKGQIVARIAQPALAQQLESQKRRLDELNADAKAGVLTATTSGRRDRLKGDVERMENALQENGKIVSGIEGRVVELRAVVGEHTNAGKPIVALENTSQNQPIEALLYFDSHIGKSLKPGMRIELVPSVARKERDGVLLGRVRVVEDFPSTRVGMMGALRNDQLVDSFIQAAGGAPIAVRAELLPDPSTPSHFTWSSGKGPAVVLSSGTRCEAAVITHSHRPIALVFPALDYGN